MKKIIVYALLLITVNSTFGQQTNPTPSLTKADYLQKSRKQKTTAWLMLGGGTVVSFVGLTQLNFAGSENGEVNNTPGTVLFFAGVATVIGSIPFFSAAKKNRNKAISVSFKSQSFSQFQKNNFAIKASPTLNLKIRL